MTRVYVDMVADLFHYGHVEFLRRSRGLGDELLVGVHSDEVVASYKRTPVMTMPERIRVVEACRYVDEVIPNAPLCVDRDWIDRHRIDIVAHGDDFDDEQIEYCYGVPKELGLLRLLAHTPGISTSDIVQRIARRLDERDL